MPSSAARRAKSLPTSRKMISSTTGTGVSTARGTSAIRRRQCGRDAPSRETTSSASAYPSPCRKSLPSAPASSATRAYLSSTLNITVRVKNYSVSLMSTFHLTFVLQFVSDNFIRNCHETYKTVLKNVAFSITMGRQLSHVGSKSLRTAYDKSNSVLFPGM